MAVTKRTRFEVLRRDNHTCRYCGAKAPDVPLAVDHVIPQALGGSDDPSNLVTACTDCNSGKASSAPDGALVADVTADALRWAAAMKRATTVMARRRAARDEYAYQALTEWERWTYGDLGPAPTDADWHLTFARFYEARLPFDELREAIEIAARNGKVQIDNKWTYMCGVAWSKLTELQDIARQLLTLKEQ